MKELNIRDIENANEGNIAAMAEEHLRIKGHDVYMVDLGDCWGYSSLVYFGGAPISHANNYALNHPHRSAEELRTLYLAALTAKLYTDEELAAPLTGYADYRRRCDYLVNLHSQRQPYVSAFYIGDNRPNTDGMYCDHVSYAWYADANFVRRRAVLAEQVKRLFETVQEDERFMAEAFETEMWNREYCINWSGDSEVLGVFGFRSVKDLTSMQRRAYAKARANYLSQCDC